MASLYDVNDLSAMSERGLVRLLSRTASNFRENAATKTALLAANDFPLDPRGVQAMQWADYLAGRARSAMFTKSFATFWLALAGAEAVRTLALSADKSAGEAILDLTIPGAWALTAHVARTEAKDHFNTVDGVAKSILDDSAGSARTRRVIDAIDLDALEENWRTVAQATATKLKDQPSLRLPLHPSLEELRSFTLAVEGRAIERGNADDVGL